MGKEEKISPRILSNCYMCRTSSGENFIPEHVFAYQELGSLKINDGYEATIFDEGEFRLAIRNRVTKFEKRPPIGGGEYKSISIAFDLETLKEFSVEYNYKAGKKFKPRNSVIRLKKHPHYKSIFDSLEPYLPFSPSEDDSLVKIKMKEALLTLLKVQPELADVLFDFEEPGKINLKAFMERHYQYNLKLPRFAYLTGRSLSSFKRDFEEVFNMTPGKWILEKRLNEAYYLITEKGSRPTEIYTEVGFEDLSHFSYTFKKRFGVAPTQLLG